MHPVADHPITTKFKQPGHMWSLGWHTGVDYACNSGTDVVAPVDSYVARAAWDKAYGNYLLLRANIDGRPVNIYLCHNSAFLVKPGQTLKMGQHIAESGNTGNTSGPHCHLETRKAPYGFNGTDIIDPVIVYAVADDVKPSIPTVLDICVWNIARPRWYKPWAGRAGEINRELKDEASIYMFQEAYEMEQIQTLKEALPTCNQFTGPAGLEIFWDKNKYTLVDQANHASGIQGRFAQELRLQRKETGKEFTVINTHGPIREDSLKLAFGNWLAKLAKVSNAEIIGGDFNRSTDDLAPRKQLYDLGYRNFKAQAAITNEGTKEFMPKDQDLASIFTRPSGPVHIIGGEVDLSTNAVESDHRRIEARVVIAP